MTVDQLPAWFLQNWPEVFAKWYRRLGDLDLCADEVALSFVLQHQWVDKVVVGVDHIHHLRRLLEIEKNRYDRELIGFAIDDPMLINPRIG